MLHKRRISLVISSLNAGGAERVLSDLANHWSKSGHKVSIITLSSPKQKPFYPLEKDVQVAQLDQTSRTSLFSYIKSIIMRFFVLRKNIKTQQPDVVISFIDIMNVTTLISCIGLNIPIVVSERIDPKYHKIYKICDWLRKITYPKASCIVVQTDNASSYFAPKVSKKVCIIPNVVKPSAQTTETNKAIKNIVTIGRLDQQKDHRTLILAFSQVIKSYPNLFLTIYGEGKERKNLETLIDSLNLTNNVKLAGITSDINSALLEANLFVFPSKYEGFPNALCEAMAIGLPVITSNCSGNTDVINDNINGLLFPVGDANALASTMAKLIKDVELQKRLGRESLKISEHFNEKKIYGLWDNILDNL